MDMFFCAVAERANPAIRDKAFVVGRTIVASSSYAARKHGIRSGMAVFIAQRLAVELQRYDGVRQPEELIVVGENGRAQAEASRKMQAIVRKYGTVFLSLGDDEMSFDATKEFLLFAKDMQTKEKQTKEKQTMDGNDCDKTGSLDMSLELKEISKSHNLISTKECILREFIEMIRKEIFEATQLTASIGASENQLVAKIAADFNKPNGSYVVTDIEGFLEPLEVRKVPGIGKAIERKLVNLKMRTVGEMYRRRGEIHYLFKGAERIKLLTISAGLVEQNLYAEGSMEYGGFSSLVGGSNIHKNNCSNNSNVKSKVLLKNGRVCDKVSIKSIGRSSTISKTNCLDFLKSRLAQLCSDIFFKLKVNGIGFYSISLTLETEHLVKFRKTKKLLFLINTGEYTMEEAEKLLENIMGIKDTSWVSKNENDANRVRYLGLNVHDFRRTDFKYRQKKIYEFRKSI